MIERIDKYNIKVDGVVMPATADQEERIRAMSDDDRARLVKVMGGS